MAEFNGKQIMLVGLKGDKGEKGDKGDKGDVGDNFVIYPENYLKEIVISAYNDEEFRNSIAFSYATDKDNEGNIIYGNIALITEEIINDENNQPIGAEYSMICNGLLYHITLRENGSDYDFEVENPYYRKDDEVLAEAIASVSNAKVGITSQYVSQPSDVKEGSNIYINAKLRDSVNLLDIANLSLYSSNGTTASKDDNNSVILRFDEPNEGTSGYANVHPSLADLGLQVGDTITVSTVCNISDTTKRFSLTISFRNSEGTQFSLVEAGKFGNSGDSLSMTTVIPEGTASFYLNLVKRTHDVISSGTTFTFSQIQLQKGNEATAYEPFGAYSKGKVMQYASKNILNLPSCTEVNTSSLLGSYNTSFVSDGTTNQIRIAANGFNNGTGRWIETKQSHNYFLLLNISNNSKTLRTSSDALYVNSLQNEGNNYYAKIESSIDTTCYLSILTTDRTNFESGTTFNYAILIDLTLLGQHDFTTEEAYNYYKNKTGALSNGIGLLVIDRRRSPLVKVFDKNLYLTKPNGYTFELYEFKENPKSLNANVDINDYELIKISEYSSSGAITLQPNTNSIVYFVVKDDGSQIVLTDLSSWQAASQLEYGNVATEHSDYIAPIEIGTFDKEVDGDEKTLSFVVLGTENQNVGFIPASENDISIDFAKNVSDLTSSTFAYQSTNLANQVVELESRVSDLETEMFETQEKVNELENLQVPSVPDTGHYVLECIDGVLTWVIKE